MRIITLRIIKLFIGLFTLAVGIVMAINANLGLSPWDAFNQGAAKTTHITMGQANTIVGFAILIINRFLGERIGWGTVSNMLFVGLFIDFLIFNNLIPVFSGLVLRILLLLLGLFMIGIASYLYISAGFGTGPRDGLMVALTAKTGKSVRFIRNTIEVGVLIAAYLLGGSIGVGTVISALAIGYIIQFVFKIFKFDANKVEHRYIDKDMKSIRRTWKTGKSYKSGR
jgi:uncharacterized membrane protein YczE